MNYMVIYMTIQKQIVKIVMKKVEFVLFAIN